MPSPKRLSLDERLERELGIKPDYSRPPPGYLPTGERLTDGGSSMAPPPPPPPPGAHSYPPHAGGGDARHHHHGEMNSEGGGGLQKGSYSTSNRSHPADPPEEGRLVRVGNMLQVT